MTKKMDIQNLRNRIKDIVKEEVARCLKEDIDPAFKRVPKSQKKEFVAWVMRQYFDPNKHSKKIWFDPDVTKDNVLEYISSGKGLKLFPNSNRNLVSMWKLKLDLGSKLGTIDDDFGDDEKEEEEEKKTKYQTGDVSLKDIGKELGGVTPTLVNKLETSAMQKLSKLTGGKHPSDLNAEELEAFLTKVKTARQEGAEEFADLLLASKNIEEFIKALAKKQVLAPTDVKLMKPEEIEGLEILKSMSKDRIVTILKQDIEESNNLFDSYQSYVSKKVFPPGKRGRPSKKKD